MNLPPFHINQKVVCIDGNPWINQSQPRAWWEFWKSKYTSGPALHEICTVTGVSWRTFMNRWGVTLAGYSQDDWYDAAEFAPIQEQKAPLIKLSEIITKEKEEVLISN